MTRLLLSASDKLKQNLLTEGCEADIRSAFNFFYATQALRLFTLLWLYWTANKYLLLLQRPTGIFWFEHKLVAWLMPSLPSPATFFSVLALAVALNLWQLTTQRNYALLQAVLALCLLWLNLPQWGYGFLSHVNYTLLLAHLFLIFIPINKDAVAKPSAYLHGCVTWFYAGILFTYTLAGLWKIPTLLYKLLGNTTDVHWLHPHGSLFNAFVSYRNFDLDFTFAHVFTDYVWFWQLSFLVVVYIQTSSVVGAFRPALRPWLGLLLLLFHGMNMLVFQTFFVVASLVVVCLFTPYDLLFRNRYKQLLANASPASFSPQPSTGLTPFEQYRCAVQAKSFYLAGLLYFPGLCTVANLFNRLRSKV